MARKQTFDQWMLIVDAKLVEECGLGVLSLPDIDYRTLHEEGKSPASAAKRAIKYAKEG